MGVETELVFINLWRGYPSIPKGRVILDSTRPIYIRSTEKPLKSHVFSQAGRKEREFDLDSSLCTCVTVAASVSRS